MTASILPSPRFAFPVFLTLFLSLVLKLTQLQMRELGT
jgi:hypothetical protein